MTTNTPQRERAVERHICNLDPILARMETKESSAVTDAARTARRANHALLEALVLADIEVASQAEIARFTAEHGRPPSYVTDPEDDSDLPF